uniref:Uncharacterized protein n=1 Tax=Haptolina brevifila TaxID=156173 RepID=A0A7S2HUX5_9EUKA|mmetsp:Transcript_5785/g.12174  ORF Transcript_5785/g.12174 Transcript_5785/m.12174 type:complete len:267 (+) Transcript_5785:17-817(+)
MLALLSLSNAFSTPSLATLSSQILSPARATIYAEVFESPTGDAATMDAAANVLKASKRFGKAQVGAAQDWIEKALAGETAENLMEQKLALFDQCQVDDSSGVCKELDAALTALEELSSARGGVKAKPRSASAIFDAMFNADPVQKAVARVKKAAGAFGPEQKKAADVWIEKTMAREVTDGGASLLNEQVLLFGECLLSEDGTPSKCEDLQQALTDMQSAMIANGFEPDTCVSSPLDGLADPDDYGDAPEGYCYDPWGRLILTKMGK